MALPVAVHTCTCRCKWQNEETFDFSSASLQSVRMCPVSAVPSQSPLPSSVMKRLRDVAGKPQPVLRKTTQLVARFLFIVRT